MVELRGWRFGALCLGMCSAIALACYPIIIAPMLNTSYYKRVQKINRKGIIQEEIQPGDMKVWSDPFHPLPKREN